MKHILIIEQYLDDKEWDALLIGRFLERLEHSSIQVGIKDVFETVEQGNVDIIICPSWIETLPSIEGLLQEFKSNPLTINIPILVRIPQVNDHFFEYKNLVDGILTRPVTLDSLANEIEKVLLNHGE